MPAAAPAVTGPETLVAAVRSALAAADLPDAAPTFERPKQRSHGDWSTNVALTLAKPVGRPPREIAEAISEHLRDLPGVAGVEVAGPGFINFRLDEDAFAAIVRRAVAAGAQWGRTATPGTAGTADVEFVSANPTGPLHVGHGRWVAAGDAIARLLEATGWSVTREYYLNDAGTQVDKLGESVVAAMRGLAPPADGYRGGYVAEIAERIAAEGISGDDAAAVRERALELMLAEIEATFATARIAIDVWFSERSLHDGAVAAVIARLRAAGHVYEADGATWLRTTAFGDDKDRVLIRATGEPTYFAADCAYLADKVARGFDKAIYLLAADHHGYVRRLHALAAAEGVPAGVVEVIVGQLVHLLRDGRPVRMSKRAGDLVPFDDLLAEVGTDAARYTFLRTSIDVAMDFDIDQVVRTERDNPVHYVNYSHARITGIMRTVAERGIDVGTVEDAALERLAHPAERELIRRVGALPDVVAFAAAERAPHKIARFAEDLAEAFHQFYEQCQVVSDDAALTHARYWLCVAARQTFVNALGLLGVTPRERM